jgi:hypothetical protein
MFLEEVRKTMKDLKKYSRFLGRDSNPSVQNTEQI